jgi:Zn-finger nucleic acid-binding protein
MGRWDHVALTANCPTCNAELKLTNHDTFDSWVCPAGHGLAATLSELYERAQEDEIHRLWALARAATGSGPAAGRACPMCQRAMVSITVPTDSDEAEEGQPGDTADGAEVPVEVCVVDEVVWFEAGELEQLPRDLPDPQPTAEQEAALADIRRQFGEQIAAALADDPQSITEHITSRLSRSSRAVGLLAPRTPTH